MKADVDTTGPFAEDQLTIVPASEASWDDLATIFGITHAGECQLPAR